jgi:RNA-directed DNA polymerase
MENRMEDWEDIPFEQYEKDVFHLQRRIFCSSLRGDRTLVHRLQKLLVQSFAARCLAVRRVTERNAGKDTAGWTGNVASRGRRS